MNFRHFPYADVSNQKLVARPRHAGRPPAPLSSLCQVGKSSCPNNASVVAGDLHPMPALAVKTLGRQHLLAPLRSTYGPHPVLQFGADRLLGVYNAASVTPNEFGSPDPYRRLRFPHLTVRLSTLAETAAGQQRDAENDLECFHLRLSLLSFRAALRAETVTDRGLLTHRHCVYRKPTLWTRC